MIRRIDSGAMNEEQIDQLLHGRQRAQQQQAEQWANQLAELVATKVTAQLMPIICAEIRKARDA